MRLARLTLAAAFVFSGALPAAHQWRVARNEAGHHLALAEHGRPAAAPDQDGDHRHHDGGCGVCLTLSPLRSVAPAISPAVTPRDDVSWTLARSRPAGGIAVAGGASPRGPPSA